MDGNHRCEAFQMQIIENKSRSLQQELHDLRIISYASNGE